MTANNFVRFQLIGQEYQISILFQTDSVGSRHNNILINLFIGMPNDDFIFVSKKKMNRRNTNQRALVATGSESGEGKFNKETAAR
jgi:hypothetical protein